jgi:hypothetical protein
MAAAPHFTVPFNHIEPLPRPSAAILRFPRARRLTPVTPDPTEDRAPAAPFPPAREIAAGWLAVLALAAFGILF